MHKETCKWLALGLVGAIGCNQGTDDSMLSGGFGTESGTSETTSPTTAVSSDGTDATGSSGTASDDDGVIYDVGNRSDVGACGSGGGASVDFSYIWIANSAEGTVSKIDTETATELARYRTRADPPAGDATYTLRGPSRTSVNLAGDMVVVNRDDWGAVKIAARLEDCEDRNENGTIETSGGAGDVLQWSTGQDPADECILWHQPLPTGSRPAAWTSGVETQGDCGPTYADMRVWTAAPDPDVSGGAIVYMLDGDDGSVIDSVEIPPGDCNCPVYGPYGGAVDGENRLWTFGQDGSSFQGASWGYGPLISVEYADDGIAGFASYAFPQGERPGYGIMVDSDGRPWLAGFGNALFRFEPDTETWTKVDTSVSPAPYGDANPTLRGIQQGVEGDIWVALAYGYPMLIGGTSHGLLRVDADTAAVIDVVGSDVLTGLQMPAGVSIDYEGYVWLVDTGSNSAYKIDPADYSFAKVTNLANPYTYSDMTGVGLLNVGDAEG